MSGGAQSLAMFDELRSLARACESDADFAARFGTEARCIEWLRRVRWPEGFRCPRCLGPGEWRPERRGYACRRCRKFSSVTAGTLLHGTRKPLRTWFEALYLIVQRGANARKLQRRLRLTYKVAWTWGHKLRSLLAGAEGVRYDAERVQRGPGVRRPSADAPGPCGCTKLLGRDWKWVDDWGPERAVPFWEAHEPPPHIDFNEPRWSDIFAHWELLGTYYGSLSEKHLRAYLDELAFRSERHRRGVDERFALVAPAVASAEPRPYRALVAKPRAEGYPLSIYRLSAG